MIKALVENGRITALFIALLIVAGLGATTTLSRSEDPQLTSRNATVITPFPGASAVRVEALVTRRLEDQLRQLEELNEITSTSRTGISVISIELKDETSAEEAELVWSRARDLLLEAQPDLPTGVGATRLDEERNDAFTEIIALTWQGPGEADLATLTRYAEELQSRLLATSGTKLVRLAGEVQEEIEITLDSRELSAIGMTAGEVAQALFNADAKQTAGELYNNNIRYTVEVRGELDSLERIRNVPLRVNQNAATLRVGDIADVSLSQIDPPQDIAVVNGERAVLVSARMMQGLRIDQWTQSMLITLDEFIEQVPANIQVKPLFSQDGYTHQRLSELLTNLAIGFLLIVTVLLFTLGWRSALLVASALPLTFLFSLACMKYFGLPIHQMSITGLIVALGIMVDNAIVMVDSAAQEREAGHAPIEAVKRSLEHLWLPLLGSTLTTVLAFAPIALTVGPVGEFIGGIAFTVIFSLIGSYLISHTLIAGLAGRFIRPSSPDTQSSFWQNGIYPRALASWFRQSLRGALNHPLQTLCLVGLLPLLGFFLASRLTEQFFPPSDRDMFQIELRLPESASLTATQRMTEAVSEHLKKSDEITQISWVIGSNTPSFYYNMMSRDDGSQHFAQAMLKTTGVKATNRLIPEIQQSLDMAFPAAQILVRKLEQGPPFNAPIEIRLYGPNLDQLKNLGNEVRRIMSETPDIIHTRSSMGSALPKIWVNAQEETSNRSGISLISLSNQLQQALDGITRGSVLQSTEELPVRIRLNQSARSTQADLAGIELSTQKMDEDGRRLGLPLSALGELEITSTRGAITRRDGERVNTLEGYLNVGVLPAAALTHIKDKLESEGFHVPNGYRLEFGGEDESRNDAVNNLLASVGVIVTLLILVLVLSSNSFRITGIILAVALQSAGLGLLSVYLFDYPFGFTVIIGLMGLMGLAINAAIVILAELRSDPLAASGDSKAIRDGVLNCSRHIVSTTITTVGGFLPLILSGGGFWPPFAIAIAGGTLLTTLLSFYFVPTCFQLCAKRRPFSKQEEQASNPILQN